MRKMLERIAITAYLTGIPPYSIPPYSLEWNARLQAV
jgi:hypothetical protein